MVYGAKNGQAWAQSILTEATVSARFVGGYPLRRFTGRFALKR